MTDIICYDSHGYPLEYLTQWDLNQVLVIQGLELSTIPCVRFSNRSSKVSLVVKPTVVDNKLHVDIPNILLQQGLPIVIYLYYEYDDGLSKTRHIFTIPVIPNKMPEDYIFTENVEYVSWLEVEQQAKELIADIEQFRYPIIIDETEPSSENILWLDTSGFPTNV